MRRAIVAVCVLAASVAHAGVLSVQAHLGDLRADGCVVAFETATSMDATVEIARRQDGVLGPFLSAGHSTGTRHAIRITGLPPRERIRYRVVIGGQVAAEADTQAGPADDDHGLDFVVYGDTRNGGAVERALTVDALATAPQLAIHTGDIVPLGDDEEAWRRVFETEQPLLAEVPLYIAVGNHELYRDLDASRLRRYLPLPPLSKIGAYYSFRVGPARFIALDSNSLSAEQTAWLARTLDEAAKEPGHPHVFVFMHHPPFSTGGHCGSAVDQADWIALFEKYRPTAVFAGHDHAYERLERGGVRYFVSGGGGAPLYPEHEECPEHDRQAARLYRAEHHFLSVHLRGEQVEIEVLRPSAPPIEVIRYARGDALPATEPIIINERRSILRPITATLVVAALLGALIWFATRRSRS